MWFLKALKLLKLGYYVVFSPLNALRNDDSSWGKCARKLVTWYILNVALHESETWTLAGVFGELFRQLLWSTFYLLRYSMTLESLKGLGRLPRWRFLNLVDLSCIYFSLEPESRETGWSLNFPNPENLQDRNSLTYVNCFFEYISNYTLAYMLYLYVCLCTIHWHFY